jgi:hypothetical protein
MCIGGGPDQYFWRYAGSATHDESIEITDWTPSEEELLGVPWCLPEQISENNYFASSGSITIEGVAMALSMAKAKSL